MYECASFKKYNFTFIVQVYWTYLLEMSNVVVVLQGELTVCESPVVKLINYDGNITQRKLGESSVQLNEVSEFNHTVLNVSGMPFSLQK